MKRKGVKYRKLKPYPNKRDGKWREIWMDKYKNCITKEGLNYNDYVTKVKKSYNPGTLESWCFRKSTATKTGELIIYVRDICKVPHKAIKNALVSINNTKRFTYFAEDRTNEEGVVRKDGIPFGSYKLKGSVTSSLGGPYKNIIRPTISSETDTKVTVSSPSESVSLILGQYGLLLLSLT